jgi:inorganic pyrophosphatase
MVLFQRLGIRWRSRCFVLVNEPTFPGCVMEVKPIGVFHMADDKGPDEKVICVPVSDPIWNSLNDLSDMNPHLLKEIEHFVQRS